MARLDVLALQRAIDGYDSSSSSDEDNVTREPGKAEPTPTPAVQETVEEPATNRGIGVHSSESEEEDFDLAAVVAEGKRRQQQNKRARLQQHDGRRGGTHQSSNTTKVPQLPSPEAEIERMAAHVRGQTEKRLREETRRLQQRPEEITHVSAGGVEGEGEDAPHLSRRERWRQKHHARSPKETPQVYVGLPIGKGWHVPLVGIEGKGGYRQPSSSSQQNIAAASVAGGSSDSRAASDRAAGTAKDDGKLSMALDGKKRSLTVKEKEKLKRKKGQSSHATWKPELWMQLRQQFD